MTSVPYLHQAACTSLLKSGNSKLKKQWTSPHNDHQTQILFYHIPAMSRFDGGRADLTCISFADVCNKVKCVFRVGRIPYCCLMPVHSWIHVCLKSGASWAGTCVVKACQSKQTTTLTMLLSRQTLPSPELQWGPLRIFILRPAASLDSISLTCTIALFRLVSHLLCILCELLIL